MLALVGDSVAVAVASVSLPVVGAAAAGSPRTELVGRGGGGGGGPAAPALGDAAWRSGCVLPPSGAPAADEVCSADDGTSTAPAADVVEAWCDDDVGRCESFPRRRCSAGAPAAYTHNYRCRQARRNQPRCHKRSPNVVKHIYEPSLRPGSVMRFPNARVCRRCGGWSTTGTATFDRARKLCSVCASIVVHPMSLSMSWAQRWSSPSLLGAGRNQTRGPRYSVATACLQHAAWPRKYPELPPALNPRTFPIYKHSWSY